MPLITDLTLAQLQAATAVQIRSAITNRINAMTKRQLIALVWSVVAPDDITVSDAPIIVTRPDKQVASQSVITRDGMGAQTGRTATTWSYFEDAPGKPVDTITLVTYDAADKETARRVIKHSKQGGAVTVMWWNGIT